MTAGAGPGVGGPAAVRRGQALLEIGRHREAAEEFRRALSTDPDGVDALLGLSAACRGLDESIEATRLAFRAIALRPNEVDGHTALALAHLKGGRGPEARAAAERAVDLAPHSPYVRYVLVECLIAAGDRTRALSVANRLRADAPHDRATLAAVARASLTASRGRRRGDAAALRAAAGDALRTRLATDPEDAWAHLQMAELEELSGHHDRAIAHLVSAGRVDPQPSLRGRIQRLVRTPGPFALAAVSAWAALITAAFTVGLAEDGAIPPWAGAVVATAVPIAMWVIGDRRSRRIQSAAPLALRPDRRNTAIEGVLVHLGLALVLAVPLIRTWPPELRESEGAQVDTALRGRVTPVARPAPALAQTAPAPPGPPATAPPFPAPTFAVPTFPTLPTFPTAPPFSMPSVPVVPPVGTDTDRRTPAEALRGEQTWTAVGLLLLVANLAAAGVYARRWRAAGDASASILPEA